MSGNLYRDLGLTIVPPRAADAGKSFGDAELDCEHGRLPGDSAPPCGCWKEEEAARRQAPGNAANVLGGERSKRPTARAARARGR